MGPYIANNVTQYVGKVVGDGRHRGQCAVLVQWLTKAPLTRMWRAGTRVKGSSKIEKYTCIATFDGGVYLGLPHGNHAAVYIEHNSTGIHVYDQWKGKPVSDRWITYGADGDLTDPSNNGNCFYVIL